MEAASSAILKPTLKDRTAFIASPRRSIRVRPATADEKAEAALQADAAAKAILLIVCKSTLKIIVQERPLAGDVTEAATTISSIEKRLPAETLDAAKIQRQDSKRKRFSKRSDEFSRDGEQIKAQRTALKQRITKRAISGTEHQKGTRS